MEASFHSALFVGLAALARACVVLLPVLLALTFLSFPPR